MIHVLFVIPLSLLIGPGQPFDLAVFEDRLWITDREQQLLLSIDKWTGMDPERLHGNMVQPASIVVVHPLAKPGSKKSERDSIKLLLKTYVCFIAVFYQMCLIVILRSKCLSLSKWGLCSGVREQARIRPLLLSLTHCPIS